MRGASTLLPHVSDPGISPLDNQDMMGRAAMDRPTFADEFLLAVAVAIGDAQSRFAQDDAECDARAGYALFTNNLHAGLDEVSCNRASQAHRISPQ
jgi:hypothetical protein